jgi:hypothetical protein
MENSKTYNKQQLEEKLSHITDNDKQSIIEFTVNLIENKNYTINMAVLEALLKSKNKVRKEIKDSNVLDV